MKFIKVFRWILQIELTQQVTPIFININLSWSFISCGKEKTATYNPAWIKLCIEVICRKAYLCTCRQNIYNYKVYKYVILVSYVTPYSRINWLLSYSYCTFADMVLPPREASTSLQVLSLIDSHLTDEFFDALQKLYQGRQLPLTEIDISSNNDLTGKCVHSLAKITAGLKKLHFYNSLWLFLNLRAVWRLT